MAPPYLKHPALSTNRRRCAFTRTELLAVLTTISLLVLAAVPLLADSVRRAERVQCVNNLRLIGRAFYQWSTEHNDLTPWWLTVSEGGTRSNAHMNDLWFLFAAVSNELKSPKTLADPGDTRRSIRQATSWNSSFDGGLFNAAYQNNAVSYWLGAHATPVNPLTVISGDYNIRTEGRTTACSSGIANLWDVGPLTIGWTNAVHGIGGSLAFMDGRVQEATETELRQITTSGTTYFQQPNWNDHFLFPSN